jgi:hypothetical protein
MSDQLTPIPGDDITAVYLSVDMEVRQAVTNILVSAGNMVVATFAGTTPGGQPLVNINWKANQDMSLLMVTVLAQVGSKRFGEVWLNSLKEQISHLG